MSFEKNLARRSLEMWGSGNSDTPEEVFADTYANHQESAAVGGVATLDLAGWKAVVAENHRAFSDFRVTVLMQIAEGDLVATRWQFEATHTGVYLAIRRPGNAPHGPACRSTVSQTAGSSRAGSTGTSTGCSKCWGS